MAYPVFGQDNIITIKAVERLEESVNTEDLLTKDNVESAKLEAGHENETSVERGR